MTGERQLRWAPQGETPKYVSEDDDPAGGNFVVARTPSDGTVLLQWNDDAGQWEYGGPVDMGSEDITNAGAVDATSVSVESLSISESGTVDHGTVSGGGSGSLVSVSFTNSYSQPPIVIHEAGLTGGLSASAGGCDSFARDISTTGFTSAVVNNDSADRDIDHVGWMVLEP